MMCRRKTQSGMSMLEIIMTMFLVMMGLLVVMSSFVAIAKSSRYSERMEVATTLAQREMERVRNLPWANIQTEAGVYGEYSDHLDYRHDITVTDVGAVREVVVRIYFENGRRRCEVRTYVSNL
jgi:Tfp pilus assembly protein PilV